MKKIIYYLILLIAIGCGVPQEQYDKLKKQNQRLQSQLDSVAPLIAEIKLAQSIQGIYICKNCPYQQLEFRKNRASISFGGLVIGTGKYEVVDEFIYIDMGNLTFSFEIIDENTLKGEGLFIEGTYKKVEKK